MYKEQNKQNDKHWVNGQVYSQTVIDYKNHTAPVWCIPVCYVLVRFLPSWTVYPWQSRSDHYTHPWPLHPRLFHPQMKSLCFQSFVLWFLFHWNHRSEIFWGTQKICHIWSIIPSRTPPANGWVRRLPWPNLTLDIIRRTQLNSTSPWTIGRLS